LLRRALLPLIALWRVITRPLAWWRRRRVLAKSGWVELRLEGPIQQLRRPSRIPEFIRRRLGSDDEPQVSLRDLRKVVDTAIEDRSAVGVLVNLGELEGGWAACDAVRQQLARLTHAHKQVLVHLDGPVTNRTYLVATASTRLLITPPSMIAAVGASASTVFLRDTLKMAGLQVEVNGAGRYKSAPDRFTRMDRSDADLEQTRALVDAMDEALITSTTEGRDLDRETTIALIDGGPRVGRDAVATGLVDGIARDEDLPEAMRDLAGLDECPKPVRASRYVAARSLAPLWPSRRKQVGIVNVHGTIVERSTPYARALDRAAVQKTVVANVRAALDNERVAAVVLHVDSRGGGVVASDAIYAAVRRLNAEKPVIAYLGDYAASGGYYVACGARTIIASPLTVTGSIGVFSMIPAATELARRLGLVTDTIKNRMYADMFDLLRDRTEAERDLGRRQVEQLYEDFIGIVAEARGMDRSAVDAVAQGRVWTGADAHTHGLVDRLGGMPDAIEAAKRAAGGQLEPEAVFVRARGPQSRPGAVSPDPIEKTATATACWLVGVMASNRLVEAMAIHSATPTMTVSAYRPLDVL
jgi:protease IV